MEIYGTTNGLFLDSFLVLCLEWYERDSYESLELVLDTRVLSTSSIIKNLLNCKNCLYIWISVSIYLLDNSYFIRFSYNYFREMRKWVWIIKKEKKNNLHLHIVIGSGTGNRFFIYLNFRYQFFRIFHPEIIFPRSFLSKD